MLIANVAHGHVSGSCGSALLDQRAQHRAGEPAGEDGRELAPVNAACGRDCTIGATASCAAANAGSTRA